ncbi:mitochondrial import inner membrane translocase subunit TIM23-3-like [Ananas comosus]|uniref:Mitochondrial import inner membrane translocase subunit TIM23-3 n=1 Tax=Ananas comosus TaxID=4615 RepID=A0A199UPY0_ANACO|nr:mitochondrial import inner membrane translocase subunit TIM23-3-like [Ananas comosus]OAY66853.1 Mitochondrial import inner membrane translocase subunit TIM23-3 [Ananas comosus]
MSNFYSPSSSSDDNENRRIHRIYNPYESLHNPHAHGPATPIPIHRLVYDLPTAPEFLFDEEARLRRRSWGHNLSFYAGAAYLSGAALGGARGAAAGLRAAEPGDSRKLRLNRVLNASGLAGRRAGNAAGAMGLIFAAAESAIAAATGEDGVAATAAAGLATGAIYRAAAGPRSAAVAGAIGGLVAGIAVAGKQLLKRHVPI